MNFVWYWVVGGMLFWPVACVIGRRAKVYQGGVPVVPQQRFIHDFPNVDPTHRSKRTFRTWSFWSACLVGYLFANHMSDNRKLINQYYNRPDLKPYPAMVEQDEDEKVRMHDVKLAHSARYQKQVENEDFWRSSVVRFFFPNQADWTIRENPYTTRNKHEVYSLDNPSAAFGRNNFLDHQQ